MELHPPSDVRRAYESAQPVVTEESAAAECDVMVLNTCWVQVATTSITFAVCQRTSVTAILRSLNGIIASRFSHRLCGGCEKTDLIAWILLRT